LILGFNMYDNLGRLLFLDNDFEPDFIIHNELIYLQAIIKQALDDIENDSETKYEAMVRKQGLANFMREKMHIVKD